MTTIPMSQINALPIDKRINLVEKIWDSIPENSSLPQMTPRQKKELSKRLDSMKKGRFRLVAWENIKQRLLLNNK